MFLVPKLSSLFLALEARLSWFKQRSDCTCEKDPLAHTRKNLLVSAGSDPAVSNPAGGITICLFKLFTLRGFTQWVFTCPHWDACLSALEKSVKSHLQETFNR